MDVPRQPFHENRRSTRVPLDVSIEVEGDVGNIRGVTVVVNLHGALIRLVDPIQVGSNVRLTVYVTGKSVPARVVYVSSESPLTYGIELEKPQNIWGVSLVPDDWDEDRETAAWA